MKLKHNIIYLMSFLLFFSIIGSGCSRKGEEVVAQENLELEKENTSQDTDTTGDAATSEEVELIGEAGDEDNSPWKLISESSVNSAVTYAGFVNESVGVTVGYKGATSYTEDGGKSWSKSSNESACRFGLDLYDESFIVDCGNSSVNLVSKDKGKSWSYLEKFPTTGSSNTNKFISVIDTNNMYIGDMKSLGVSSDGGATWKEIQVPENCSKIVGMFFLTPETGYLFNEDGTLYKTKDACATWTTETIDLMGEKIPDSMMPSVTISFQDDDHGMIVYVTKSYQLVCIKTEDGGSTWQSISIPKGTCFTPYLSRDGKYLTLCSVMKKVCLYHLEEE